MAENSDKKTKVRRHSAQCSEWASSDRSVIRHTQTKEVEANGVVPSLFMRASCQIALDDALKIHFERGRPHFTVSGSLQGGFIYSLSRKSDYQNQRLQWLLLWWQLVVLSDGEFPPERNWGRLPHQRWKGQNQKTRRRIRKQNRTNSLPMLGWKISKRLKFQFPKIALLKFKRSQL